MIQLVLIGLATLVSEDLTCITTGVLIAQGTIGFLPGTLACIAGIFIGDILLFAAGRFFGRPALQWRLVTRFVAESEVDRASAWISERGALVTLLSRFTPGMRLPVYFAAGALKTDFRKFAFWLLVAALVWTPILVVLAVLLGDRVSTAFTNVLQTAAIVLVVFALIVAGRRTLKRIVEFRSRRRVYGAIQRVLRWEFWPAWLAYVPVIPYIAWLAIRHRSLTLFTAANPGIFSGGLAGESKSAILKALQPSGRVAPFILAPADCAPQVKVRRALEFGLPVVLKPDVGERGTGVFIARSHHDIERYFRECDRDTIIQQHIGGLEYGVFYYRYPDQPKGRIFAITEKRFPTVTGDGRSTVEELILRDGRAVCLAKCYLSSVGRKADEIPAEHQELPLVEIGSHCRGAIFLDGIRLLTTTLEDAIDKVARTHAGFFFGRFDVRAPSEEALRNGEFHVLELNGVSSEATHIYDPALSVWEAYRVLFTQWRIAFEIGSANRTRGAAPTPVAELMRMVSGRWGRKKDAPTSVGDAALQESRIGS